MFTDPDTMTTPSQEPGTTAAPIDGASPFIARREFSDADSEPLAVIANRYLDRRREFAQKHDVADAELEAHCEGQEELIERMQDTPAVLLDDLVAKLMVIREEIADRCCNFERQLEAVDRLVLTLADDVRRVFGATSGFDARLWVESAVRAGMDPSALIYMVPVTERPGDHRTVKQGIFCRVADNPLYEPPRLSQEETHLVIDELEHRGRADYYTLSAEANSAEQLAGADWLGPRCRRRSRCGGINHQSH